MEASSPWSGSAEPTAGLTGFEMPALGKQGNQVVKPDLCLTFCSTDQSTPSGAAAENGEPSLIWRRDTRMSIPQQAAIVAQKTVVASSPSTEAHHRVLAGISAPESRRNATRRCHDDLYLQRRVSGRRRTEWSLAMLRSTFTFRGVHIGTRIIAWSQPGVQSDLDSVAACQSDKTAPL